ncbi:hypothetical protein Bca52824_081384 [Brassica carinata]|uniref:Uncharacterized protein n=1 Tax=Brassica carinata TaxID=52824 RepID=A0A8X7PHS1_BRACI|nr:hypothetical protein Bca52824_081384 [Brassica carinata]
MISLDSSTVSTSFILLRDLTDSIWTGGFFGFDLFVGLDSNRLGPPPLVISPRPFVGPINIESSREDLVQSSERETAEPSVTDGNKKKRSAHDSSASIDAQARTGSDEPPKKKKKKEKKKRKKSIEGQSEPVGESEGHEPVVHEGSPREAATRAVVESSGSPNVPLEKKKKPSSERDASASAAKTPPVAPPATTGGGSTSEERRIKLRDRVEFNSQGDHATKRSNEPTEREVGESSVQEHEVVSRLERSEDETAPLVLDPAPSMANLVVSEESLIPILGVSDANPTPLLGVEEAGSGPVDLLELSDSSAKEEGGEKSDERIPGDSLQGTEEGVVNEVENPLASTTDEAGGASDQLEARVAEEDLDRVEN